MSKTRRLLQLVLVLVLATSVQGQAAARGAGGDSPPPSIATVEITPFRLDWSPVPGVGNDPITLAIAGPQGFYFEKRFPRGTPPAFDLGEVRGRTLPDGAYSYELRTTGKGGGRVQSGFFSVHDGNLFVPAAPTRSEEEQSAPTKKPGTGVPLKEIVVNEDLIVVGEACIGADCQSGDGGVPLRLKNKDALRLDFSDLASANTNNHSWAIQANDLSSGSGEYLAVKDSTGSTTPFTITGNAPDNSLFVSSSGNVGIATATPAVKLDVKVTSSGNAVARFQNLSGTGFSGIECLNAAGNSTAYFGTDNSNAVTRVNSIQSYPMVFLTESAERMRITSAGKVGIGTSSPADKLHIVDSATGAVPVRVQSTSSSGFSGIEYDEEGGTTSLFVGVDNGGNYNRINSLNDFDLRFLSNGTERLRFNNSGNVITAVSGAVLTNGGTWQSASSREAKKNIVDLSNGDALKALKGLNPVTFQYKAEPDEQYVGFVAEDVPELVATNDHKHLSPMDVVAVLTKVVQEQQKTIEALNARLEAVEHRP